MKILPPKPQELVFDGELNAALLYNALSFYGVTEVKGRGSNVIILSIIHRLHPGWKDDSTYAWCSAYVNDVAVNVQAENTLHTDAPGTARSWLKVGEPIEEKDMRPGDVIVFWRQSPNSWKGHVGFYVSRIGSYYMVLGGNQSHAISIAPYPVTRFLGARRLRKMTSQYHDRYFL